MKRPEREQKLSELRQEIARLRRRIDGRLHSTRSALGRLVSWRTYVRRFPGQALTGALGLGLAASAGLKRKRLRRWLGMRLLRGAWERFRGQLWHELTHLPARFGAKTGTAQTTEATQKEEAHDGRA